MYEHIYNQMIVKLGFDQDRLQILYKLCLQFNIFILYPLSW